MSRETYHTIVGGLVLLLGALFLIVSYRGGQPGEVSGDGYRLTARFQAIDGVTPGTDVLMTGVRVGEVEKQYLDAETNQAVVAMRIREGVEIPRDSAVKILSEGMAGNKYLKISPGGDLETLSPGERFDYTQSAVRFEELLQKIVLAAEARRKQEGEAAADGGGDAGAADDGSGLPGDLGPPKLQPVE